MTRARALGAVLVLSSGALAGGGAIELWHHRQQSPRPKRLPLSVTSVGGAREPGKDPRAVRLCEALQGLPGRRAAQCCSTAPSELAMEQCVVLTSEALRAGTIRIDARALDVCVRATAGALAGCDWVASRLPAPPAECGEVIQGTVPRGGRCRSSLECGGRLRCGSDGEPNDSRRCRDAAPVGAACEEAPDALAAFTRSERNLAQRPRCDSGFCEPVSRRCQPKPLELARCRATIQCGPGQRCEAGACRSIRTLPARARAGEECGADLDCEAGGCVVSPSGNAKVCGMSCPAPAADLLSLRAATK